VHVGTLCHPISAAIVGNDGHSQGVIMRAVAHDAGCRCVGEARTVAEAVMLVRTARPDVLVVDIDAAESSALSAVSLTPAGKPCVIIAIGTEAMRAQDIARLATVDYLVKPLDETRVAAALRRARDHLKQLRAVPDEPWTPVCTLSRLLVRTRKCICVLDVGDIDWISAADYYARVHVGARNYLIRRTMNELATRLDPTRFTRVHRSSIVNLERVREIHPYFKGQCVLMLSTGQRIIVSRQGRAALELALGERF